MTIDEFKNKQITTIDELISTLQKQIFSEDKSFLENMRRICEGMMYINLDKSNNYEFFNLPQEKRKDFLKDVTLEENEGLRKISGNISKYLHFNFENEFTFIDKKDVSNLINEINKEIKINNYGLKEINVNNIPERITLSNNQAALKEYSLYETIGKHYNIPMFQRRFSWGNEDIKKIATAIFKDSQLDLGIIYLTEKNELIDGQQRIHTLYILNNILFTFFNDKLDYKIEKSHLEIKRERETDNWRGNFELLNKEIESADNSESDLNEIYLHLKEIVCNERKEKIISNLKRIFINLKKIESREGVRYFRRINDEGQQLKTFEKIYSKWIEDNKTDVSRKEKVFDLWSRIDDIFQDISEEKTHYIESFFSRKRSEIESLEKDIFIALNENFINSFEESGKGFLLFRDGKKFNLSNTTDEIFKLLFEELVVRSNDSSEIEMDREIIKRIFFENSNPELLNIKLNSFTTNYVFSILDKYSVDYLFTMISTPEILSLNGGFNISDEILKKINPEDVELINKFKDPEYNGYFEIIEEKLISISDDQSRFKGTNILPLSVFNSIVKILVSFVNNDIEIRLDQDFNIEMLREIIEKDKIKINEIVEQTIKTYSRQNTEGEAYIAYAVSQYIVSRWNVPIYKLGINGILNSNENSININKNDLITILKEKNIIT